MAVDPGITGGIAFMRDDGFVMDFMKMPVKPVLKEGKKTSKRIIDIAAVAALIARYEPGQVFIEQVHAMPRNGAVSMFTFGMGYGMILGLSLALEALLETKLVTPQRWQGFLYGKGYGPDLCTKGRAYKKFSELWPDLVRDGVSHDGIVDACLIAEYGRRQLSLN